MSTAPVRRRFGLAVQLAAVMLAGTTALFGLAFGVQYATARRAVLKNAEAGARATVDAHVNRIAAMNAGVEQAPTLLARAVEEDRPDAEELRALLRSALAANPAIYGGTVAFEPRRFSPDRALFAPYYFRSGTGLRFEWLDANVDYTVLDWYVLPRELGRPVWSEPYFDEGGGRTLMSTYSVPFFETAGGGRRVAGVATADVALEGLVETVAGIRVARSGYAFLISVNGVFVAHPDRRRLMREGLFDVAEETNDPELRRIGREMVRGRAGFAPIDNAVLGRDSFLCWAPVPGAGWSLGVVVPKRELLADLARLNRSILLIGGVGIAALWGLAAWVAARTVRPILPMVELAGTIAEGDLGAALARAPEVERAGASTSAREYQQLSSAFAAMAGSLHGLVSHVRHSGAEVSAAAERIGRSASELGSAAHGQGEAIAQVAEASGGILTTTHGLAGTIDAVAQVSGETARRASESPAAHAHMGSSMRELAETSTGISARLSEIREQAEGIGSIVTTIVAVADRTNLLSLNAAIEAEKAGDAGRGFAVVAREIRRLADQTAIATLDIEHRVGRMHGVVARGAREIDAFVERARGGITAVERISGQLEAIIERVEALAPRFADVRSGMDAQERGTGRIADAVSALNASVGPTRAALEEFSEVAEELAGAVALLEAEVSRFRVEEPADEAGPGDAPGDAGTGGPAPETA
jgi:methyl-accepting chemotaxis protein